MKRTVAALSVLLVTACSQPIPQPFTGTVTSTQYQVQEVTLLPIDRSAENLNRFAQVEPAIMRKLQAELKRLPRTGQPVDLAITVTKMKGRFHATPTNYIPEDLKVFNITGEAVITDHITGKQIASKTIGGLGTKSESVDSLFSLDGLSASEANAVSGFVREVVFFIYPEQEEALRKSANPRK